MYQNERGQPTKGSGRRSYMFGEVNKTQIQRRVLPRQFLQASYYKHHVNHRALGNKSKMFLRQNVLDFAVVTRKATRHGSDNYSTGVSHEGDATIVATLRPIFLLVQHFILASFH